MTAIKGITGIEAFRMMKVKHI